MAEVLRKSLVGLICLSWAGAAHAAPFVLTHTIDNPAPGGSDHFGYTLDVSGTTAVIGAFTDDVGGNIDQGTAYLVDTTTGAVTHTLLNPNPDNNSGDQFGISVAIDGTRAVVGSRRANGVAGAQGEAYIFNTVTGSLETTLFNPDPSSSDSFGWAVDISGDLIVASALFEDQGGGFNAGAAYVFDAASGVLLNELINPLTTDNALFGHSIAIDGNLIAVGVRDEDLGATNSGAVHVFDATTGGLISTLADPFAEANGNFGWAVDIHDGQVLVGAPNDDAGGLTNSGRAYLFDAVSGSLVHTFEDAAPGGFGGFGLSVDLGSGIAVVGERGHDAPGLIDPGEVYLFDTVTGDLMQSLLNPFPASGDQFGGTREEGVAIDGNTLLVGAWLDDTGAPDAGQAYIYTMSNGVPAPGALALLGLGLIGLGWRRKAR